MAKGIRATLDYGNAGLAMGTMTGTDAVVDAAWTSIETTGKFVNGNPVLSADLYSTATIVSSKVVGGTISDSYNANQPFISKEKVSASSVVTATLGNGDVHNVPANGRFIRITGPTGAFGITGFAGGIDGQTITILNTTAQAMTIYNANAGSATENRILCNTGADLVTTAAGSVTMTYSSTDSRWIVWASAL